MHQMRQSLHHLIGTHPLEQIFEHQIGADQAKQHGAQRQSAPLPGPPEKEQHHRKHDPRHACIAQLGVEGQNSVQQGLAHRLEPQQNPAVQRLEIHKHAVFLLL